MPSDRHPLFTDPDYSFRLLRDAQEFLTHPLPERQRPPHLAAAWREFYAACHDLMLRLTRTMKVSPAEADDVIQGVWVRAIRKLPAFAGQRKPTALTAWLYRAVQNQVIDQYRTEIRHAAISLTSEDPCLEPVSREDDPTLSAERISIVEAVDQALARLGLELGDECLHLMQARWFEDQTIGVLAEASGLTYRQVWLRLHRGQRWLCLRLASVPR